MSRDLGDNFSQVFELIPALDDVSLDQVYRIRHDVYCRDLGWEPVREDGRESDEYDRHSFHCLLRRRDNGVAVGCTRLILARPEDPAFPLPFEISCRDVLDKSIADPAKVPRHTIGEVSRLAVAGAFRQRKGEACAAVSMTEADFEGRGAQARFPFIPVSLYLGAAAIARRFGIEHVFVLTEPRLASHFVSVSTFVRSAAPSTTAAPACRRCSVRAKWWRGCARSSGRCMKSSRNPSLRPSRPSPMLRPGSRGAPAERAACRCGLIVRAA